MGTLASVFSVSTFLLSVSITVVMLVIRRLAEIIWPTLAAHTPKSTWENIWERILLPTLPAVVGAVFCVLAPVASTDNNAGFSFPSVVVGTWSHVLYGVFVGFFSSYIYQLVKFLLKKEWGIDVVLPGDTVKPKKPTIPPAPVVVAPQASIPAIPPPPPMPISDDDLTPVPASEEKVK